VPKKEETYLGISADKTAIPSFGYPDALLLDGSLPHDGWYEHYIMQGQRVAVF